MGMKPRRYRSNEIECLTITVHPEPQRIEPEAHGGGRFCYYIPADAYVEGQGFRVSVVFETESGHRPTGTWPYTGAAGETMPWFWGQTYPEAKRLCAEQNKKLGLSDRDVDEIIAKSMVLQHAEER